jgi:hypothetical protein
MVQVDPIQSYLNLKIGLPPVLKAGSSGKFKKIQVSLLKKVLNFYNIKKFENTFLTWQFHTFV